MISPSRHVFKLKYPLVLLLQYEIKKIDLHFLMYTSNSSAVVRKQNNNDEVSVKILGSHNRSVVGQKNKNGACCMKLKYVINS